MRRRGLMFGGKKLPPLPDGYTRLRYVENTDSAYIDTGINLTENYSVECEAMLTTFPTVSAYIFGAVYACTPANRGVDIGIMGRISLYNKNIWVHHGDSMWQKKYNYYIFVSNGAEVGKKVYMKLSPTYGVVKAKGGTYEQVLNSTTKFHNVPYVTQTDPGVYKLIIFDCWHKQEVSNDPSQSHDWRKYGYPFLGRIYYFNVWNGDTQTMALVPAKRDSDDMVGMYDTINDVFYEPQDGSLIAGGVI